MFSRFIFDCVRRDRRDGEKNQRKTEEKPYLRQISDVICIEKQFFQTPWEALQFFGYTLQRTMPFIHRLHLAIAAFEYWNALEHFHALNDAAPFPTTDNKLLLFFFASLLQFVFDFFFSSSIFLFFFFRAHFLINGFFFITFCVRQICWAAWNINLCIGVGVDADENHIINATDTIADNLLNFLVAPKLSAPPDSGTICIV